MGLFMARAVGMVVIDLALCVFLVGAGILVVNLGLLSKRDEDRTLGHREPSDVNVLERELWPRREQRDFHEGDSERAA